MAPRCRDMKLLKNILNSLNYALAQDVPISLKKERVKSVLGNTFLRDNARKKSYAEILQEDNMQDFPLEAENSDTEDQQQQDRDTEG